MAVPDKISLNIANKPNLKALMESDPAKAKEVIDTFVGLIEESLDPEKGIAWVDLPKKFHKDLTFNDLILGVLRGVLDAKDINPDNWDTLGIDVHPLALFTVKEGVKSGKLGGYKVSYNKWREHFQMEGKPSQETISQIIRDILRYARYVNFKLIFDNMKSDWEVNATYRGLGAEHVKRLPFYPALQYQAGIYGELGGVGKFFDDIGAFNCGLIGNDEMLCPACKIDTVKKIGKYKVCPSCNAGYVWAE